MLTLNITGTTRKMSQQYFSPTEYTLSQNLKLTLKIKKALFIPSPQANFTARLHGKNVSRVPGATFLHINRAFFFRVRVNFLGVTFRFCLSGVLRWAKISLVPFLVAPFVICPPLTTCPWFQHKAREVVSGIFCLFSVFTQINLLVH